MYNEQAELENRKRLMSQQQAADGKIQPQTAPLLGNISITGFRNNAPKMNAPENAGWNENMRMRDFEPAYHRGDYDRPIYGGGGLLGEPMQQPTQISPFDLPEEARPFTLAMGAKGQVQPKFNLNTKSGMAYYLKSQGMNDDTIARNLGLQNAQQLGGMMQEEFRQLKQKYEQPDIEKLYKMAQLEKMQKETELLGQPTAKEQAESQEKLDFKQKATEKGQEVLNLVNEMQGKSPAGKTKTPEGLKESVGFGLQKMMMPWREEGDFISGTDAADYAGKLERLKSLLSIESMQNFKGLGPMSEREFAAARAAATSLDLGLSESEFKKELGRIEEKIKLALSGTLDKPSQPSQSTNDDPLGIL